MPPVVKGATSAAPDDVHKLFKGRDGAAYDELAATLPPLGYQFGTTIHFYPNDKRPLRDLPELRAGDLLVLTTRPPLTDREAVHKPRRIILSSENDLEKLIFKQLFLHISYCTRRHIHLSPDSQARLTADVSRWKSLEFYENSGATHPLDVSIIKKHLDLPKKQKAGVRVRASGPRASDGVRAARANGVGACQRQSRRRSSNSRVKNRAARCGLTTRCAVKTPRR